MVDRINAVEKLTDNPYLNLYELKGTRRDGGNIRYYTASRRRETACLKALAHDDRPDGVLIYGVYGEKKDRIVLVRQFRYPINQYVYEFPAGLVEPGEELAAAGIREIYEETGLRFEPKATEGAYCRPFFTTVGMTDESCGTIYGYCSGTPSIAHQEASEDIEVVLADRQECRRILKEENVAIMCAYMLMHFISTEGDPLEFLDA